MLPDGLRLRYFHLIHEWLLKMLVEAMFGKRVGTMPAAKRGECCGAIWLTIRHLKLGHGTRLPVKSACLVGRAHAQYSTLPAP